MLQRIRAAYDPQSGFINKKLSTNENPDFLKEGPNGKKPVDEFREEYQKSVVKSYVDNTYFIRAPFFGIAFDINDMGLIGGTSLIAVLVLLRFCLSREIRNLEFSFEEATQHEKLYQFYHALAMHQVFTVPSMRAIPTRKLLKVAPKLVYALPVAVYLFGAFYDYYTVFVLKLFSFRDNWTLLTLEAAFSVLILWLCWRCRNRQRDIDSLWAAYGPRAFGVRSRVFLLDPALVSFFEDDEAVNNALRESIKINH